MKVQHQQGALISGTMQFKDPESRHQEDVEGGWETYSASVLRICCEWKPKLFFDSFDAFILKM